MRIALAQVCTGRDLDANLDLVADRTAQAAEAGADLVVFPEATMRAFGHNLTSIAEPLDGPWAQSVRRTAREHDIIVVAGMFTPGPPKTDGGEPRVRNTLLVTGPDVDAAYDKIHLFDAFSYAESDTVAPGTEPVVLPLAGVPTGLATCYDVRFPGLFLTLADQGARLIVLPASWGAGEGKLEQWRTLVRARALDATCFVAACGQADPDTVEGASGVATSSSAPRGIGHSMVVDPLGRVLHELGPGPGVAVCDLNLDRVDEIRRTLPVLVNRRL